MQNRRNSSLFCIYPSIISEFVPLYRQVYSSYVDPIASEITSKNISNIDDYKPTIRHTWWRHQMETFSALLAICAGNSPVPVTSPHKGQWRGALMFTLICARINGWVNNRETGDLRRFRAHYDVIAMGKNELSTWKFLRVVEFYNVLEYGILYFFPLYETGLAT